MSATTTAPPGRAGELLAALGDRAVLHGMYDTYGSSVYHHLAAQGDHEVRELLAVIRQLPGPVLDLAAGSGRLTMPFLALGREVTALELSPSMLGLLTDRLATGPAALRERCTVVRGDMSDFSLEQRFAAVVLGTTSISLLDETGRPGLYRCVQEHLAEGGRFLLSTVEMDAARSSDIEAELTVPTGAATYRMYEYWAPGDAARTVTIFPDGFDVTGEQEVHVCTTTIGVLSANQLEAELAGAGFAVRARHPLPMAGARHPSVLLEAEAMA
ncbi:daptide-type RiPP biosynthesis methyltransferase [Streptomyces sp. NPDC039022]|uniref:daptide-type RiPP biosynthesis methyltransferase n=1 Tax=unclassified Streptomyces TaxID=2593676 RepID=UPI0034006C6F